MFGLFGVIGACVITFSSSSHVNPSDMANRTLATLCEYLSMRKESDKSVHLHLLLV